MDNATIAAIATPAGSGGISIVKISGPDAVAIATAVFRLSSPGQHGHGAANIPLASHRLYHGRIVDPASGRTLDEVLLSVMRAPRSYTREDVVEINSHGSPAAVRGVLELVLKNGARLAGPGEFTLRAFLNGRIDLTQAEAVADLINARSERALELSAAQAGGTLRREIEALRRICLDLLTRLEAAIDFPEEVDEMLDCRSAAAGLRRQACHPLQRLLRNYAEGRAIREGLTVAIVGRPNVGKSSLLNRLLDRERAIVTPYPGTTRDGIEETIVLQGVAVSLWDTAGLHASADPVESLGMQKTLECIAAADLILFVIEALPAPGADDGRIYDKIKSKQTIVVINKVDLVSDFSKAAGLPEHWSPLCSIPVSALTGQGMEDLREAIRIAVGNRGFDETAAGGIPNLRQKTILARCLDALNAAAAELENGAAAELASIHLTEAVQALGEILGIGAKSDILEAIFSRFCIGK